MSEKTVEAKPRSKLAAFGYGVLAILLILAGVVLLILGSTDLLVIEVAGSTAASVLPGLAVIGLGFVALFKGRRSSNGEYHDPDEHLGLPRADHRYDRDGDGDIDRDDFPDIYDDDNSDDDDD